MSVCTENLKFCGCGLAVSFSFKIPFIMQLSTHILEALRGAVFVLSTASMLLLIRLIGEIFGTHIYFFLPWMFLLQSGFLALLYIYRKWRGQVNLDAILDAKPWKNKIIFVMSGGLTLNAAGVFTTSKYIPGPLQTVIGMSPLIFAPLFDRLLLGAKVSIKQIIGVIICLGGITVSLVAGGMHNQDDVSIVAVIVQILALAIMPGLSMLKEVWFVKRPHWHIASGRSPNIEWNVLFYCFFQIPWHILFFVFYGSVGMPKYVDTGSNFKSGAECLFKQTGGASSENCYDVWWVVLALGFVTVVQITSSFYVAKEDSGAYTILLQAAAPFLADLVFGSKVIMGPYKEAVSSWTWLALAVTVVGCGIYRWGSIAPADKVEHRITWFHRLVLGDDHDFTKDERVSLAKNDHLLYQENIPSSSINVLDCKEPTAATEI